MYSMMLMSSMMVGGEAPSGPLHLFGSCSGRPGLTALAGGCAGRSGTPVTGGCSGKQYMPQTTYVPQTKTVLVPKTVTTIVPTTTMVPVPKVMPVPMAQTPVQPPMVTVPMVTAPMVTGPIVTEYNEQAGFGVAPATKHVIVGVKPLRTLLHRLRPKTAIGGGC